MRSNLEFSTSGASKFEDNREVGEPLVNISGGESSAAPATVIGEIRSTTTNAIVLTTLVRGKGVNQVSRNIYSWRYTP